MLVTELPKTEFPYAAPCGGSLVEDFEFRSDGKYVAIYSPSNESNACALCDMAEAPFVSKETFRAMYFGLLQNIALKSTQKGE